VSPLTIIAMACFASVIYLTAAALTHRANQMAGRGRPVLIAVAVLLVVMAAVVVATNNTRDVVLGFSIGGILTPVITNRLSRRKTVSSR
jgi:hypothetical protein